MIYKISLSDNSFIVVNENYNLSLYRFGRKRVVTVKDYLINNNKFKKYYLIDMIDNHRTKRIFNIEEFDNTKNYPLNTRLKLAKDIKVGDTVIGKDGQPRKVKELHTGEDEMFEISIGDTSYTVNGGHILALVDKDTGEHLEIPVNIYMHMNDEFRSHYVMEKIIEE